LHSITFQKIHKLKNENFPGTAKYSGEYDFRRMKKKSFWKRIATSETTPKDGAILMLKSEFTIDIRNFIGGLRGIVWVIFD